MSVINNNSSQTRRTSESIFLPGESTSPVRLDVLRVLGLRPFIVQNCSLEIQNLNANSGAEILRSSLQTRPDEDGATIVGHNCNEICCLHILVEDLQYRVKTRISLMTSIEEPQDQIQPPVSEVPIWKIRRRH